MSNDAIPPTEELFRRAEGYLNTHNVSIGKDDKLKLYAYYKQATVGDCTIPKPGLFEFVARAKYDAWRSVSAMTITPAAAMEAYVDLVESLNVGWSRQGEYDYVPDPQEEAQGMGNSVSAMAMEPEEEVDDLIGCACRNDLKGVLRRISEHHEPLDATDEDGLTALHHAADRGHADLVVLLLEKGAPINATTKDGETALHYACISEQLSVAQLLLERGCDITLRDAQGKTAYEQADSAFVAQLVAAHPSTALA